MLLYDKKSYRKRRKPKRPKMRLTPESTVEKGFYGASRYVRNNYPEECARFFDNRRLHRCRLYQHITEDCADLINMGRAGDTDKIDALGWDYSWVDYHAPVGPMLIFWHKEGGNFDPQDVWDMTRKQRKLPLKPLIACYENETTNWHSNKYLSWFAVSINTRSICKDYLTPSAT